MGVRGRKFVDRIGFENWDPFQSPKEPTDLKTARLIQNVDELTRKFTLSNPDSLPYTREYLDGVRIGAWGVINEIERFKGIFDFCKWYWHSRNT